jgi:hypothetical protein
LAILHPPYEVIKQLKVPPTKGELQMLDFLRANLNDEYEIYFQPFLNGDCPDIVLMRKDGGIMIIEVKGWDLNNYHLDFRKRWFVNHNGALIKSPISQVLKYKENIYDLHIQNLLELRLKDYKYWFIVNCAIFFPLESHQSIRNFLLSPFKLRREFLVETNAKEEAFNQLEKSEEYYINFLDKNIELIGADNLNSKELEQLLDRKWISRNSIYFKDELYDSFRRYLKPSFHSFEDGRNFKYSKKQLDLSESKAGEQKIKGVVGSGKTQVLAKRAVNAYKRTQKKILILTYNISLKNYIHDKISQVREDFYWDNFHILNYHDFFNSVMNNVGIEFDIPTDLDLWGSKEKEDFFNNNYYNNFNLFENYKEQIDKYDTILIDEVQDFRTIWLRIIKKYFLSSDGEFVVFGDSKQDIYNRVSYINSKKELVIPESPGRWAEMNESFRLTPTITAFAASYQEAFLADKHSLDSFDNLDFQSALFDKVHSKYFGQLDCVEIVKFIKNYSIKNQIPPNDICVLSLSIDVIRELDFEYRKLTKERTYIMSETKEYYDMLIQKYSKGKQFRKEIEKIRKNKKLHFWMNSGMTKFSTIHSYKGWEIQTLFLIVQKDKLESTYAELVYTGFTRCMNNLVIINVDDSHLNEYMGKLQYVENIQ